MDNALDASLVVIKSSGIESEVQDEINKSGNDTNVDDVDIRPVYDEEPMAKVQLTVECNVFATGQQHTEQPEFNNEGRRRIEILPVSTTNSTPVSDLQDSSRIKLVQTGNPMWHSWKTYQGDSFHELNPDDACTVIVLSNGPDAVVIGLLHEVLQLPRQST
ncbi:hypothetical protein Tco_0713971 [Tanacetum coccineum]